MYPGIHSTNVYGVPSPYLVVIKDEVSLSMTKIIRK